MGFGAWGRAVAAHIIILSLLPLLAACGPAYFAAEDAPDFIRKGGVDARLVLTRAMGPPLASILRQFNLNHGKLHKAAHLEAWLRPRLKPLDIVMVRAKPGFTRANVPTHFSHSLVWLGSADEMKRLGVWNLPQVKAQREGLFAGGTVIEASEADVHLGGFSEITNVDEILVLRPRRGGARWAREKYAGLLAELGTRFDNSFDLLDTTRLTCIELIAKVFPEFGMPVRYSKGRYALVPDDLVRQAIEGSPRISFVLYVTPSAGHGFEQRGKEDAAAVLTRPHQGPAT
jgi:hypothetical protein